MRTQNLTSGPTRVAEDTRRSRHVGVLSLELILSFRWLRDTALSLAGGHAMHALIIEDEPLTAMEIEDVLARSGYQSFDFAMSAHEAVAAATLRYPDLIISDPRLVSSDELKGVEEMRRNSTIPIIFITSNPRELAAKLPNHEVLRKPFRPDGLEAALRRLGAG